MQTWNEISSGQRGHLHRREWDQRHDAGVFDSSGQTFLVPQTSPAIVFWHYFAVFCEEFLDQLDIFVIDMFDMSVTEPTFSTFITWHIGEFIC